LKIYFAVVDREQFSTTFQKQCDWKFPENMFNVNFAPCCFF